jgi:iron complex outermembrane recepter protein
MAIRPSTLFRLSPIALASMVIAGSAHAQQAAAPTPAASAPAQTLATVTVTAKPEPVASVAGWGDIPLSLSPVQATVFGSWQLKDRGATRLADTTRLDASVNDSYNSEGYWDYLSVRGFVLDNRFNYRRDGLPISAETSIPLDNKERVEILKGVSGMQAGTSAPGGLANVVVKRPTDDPLRQASIGWRQKNTWTVAMDMSQRFGEEKTVGVRLNAAYERLRPLLRDAEGKRHLVAAAADWRLTRDTLVEAEFETSHRSQPSQPAFSLLGNRVPEPTDPRINLNNQPWSQPVVLDGNTASLRVTQRFDGWKLTAHGATQRLRTDDRLAFPFGCGAEGNFDRYCSDGTYDLYDFRSEGERRRTDALELTASGDARLAGMQHQWAAGGLATRVKNRFGGQTFDYAGVGNVDGTLVTPPNDPRLGTNTNRDERSSELFVRDGVHLTENLGLWLGLRHTRLKRESVQTDGSDASSFTQSFNTPFVATSVNFARDHLAYVSWGRGTESDVAARLPQYTNAGQALPAARSRQVELGYKWSTADSSAGLAAFDITRPYWGDVGPCDGSVDSCTTVLDGRARHRGLEAQASVRLGAWSLGGSVMVLKARVEDRTARADLNGKEPTNTPARTLKLQTRYQVPQLSGLSLQADARITSKRQVLEDNSVQIPGYGVLDLSLRHDQKQPSGGVLTWRAGIDNALDRRAWRESPFQFGHAYLYPVAGRAFRVSVESSL